MNKQRTIKPMFTFALDAEATNVVTATYVSNALGAMKNRNAEIVRCVANGSTLAATGKQFRVNGETVREKCRRFFVLTFGNGYGGGKLEYHRLGLTKSLRRYKGLVHKGLNEWLKADEDVKKEKAEPL